MKNIVIGGGCFWCVEAVMQRINGVENVISGYAGGNIKNPSYKEVCSGLTGHAEVVKIEYDDNLLSLRDLLMIFMTSHDPTTLNRQGADVGTQYRSIILYENPYQKEIAQEVIEHVNQYYDDNVVTEVSPLETFYEAEKNHQNYYNDHSSAGYCRIVINPKIQKLKKQYADKLKKEYV